jgi:hypothetical protein
MFYVYEHLRQDTGAVFYVGKGSGARFKTSQGRNKWWQAVAAKYGYKAQIKITVDCEELAYLAEQELIDKYRRLGYNLVNITDGGEGMTGYKQPKDVIERRAEKQRGQKRPSVSAKMLGVPKTYEHKANLSASRIGLKISDEARKKLSEKRKGMPSPMSGKTHSEKSKLKIAEASKGKKNPFFGKTHSLETVKKIIAANVGRKDSNETRLKKSIARIGSKNPRHGVKLSQEQIERQRATLMARPKITCLYCKKTMSESNAKRWHFENCKMKGAQNGSS